MLLPAGFAGFALVLEALGIYAVNFFSASQSVQEIGIRMALGASVTDLQSRILLRTLGFGRNRSRVGNGGSRILSSALGGLLFG